MNELVQQGIAAYKSGDKATARRYFLKALGEDRKDITAWIWLSSVVASDAERRQCLEAVLKINPNHEIARKGLAKLDAMQVSQEPTQQIEVPDFFNQSPIDFHRPVEKAYPTFVFEPDESAPPTAGPAARPGAGPAARPGAGPAAHPVVEEWAQRAAQDAAQSAAQSAAQGAALGEPLPPAAPVVKTEKRTSKKNSMLPLILMFILIMVLCSVGVYFFLKPYMFRGTLPNQAANPNVQQVAQALPNDTATPKPSATASLTPSNTPTYTPRPTKTATPSETFPVSGATLVSQMEKIQRQVSDLRGLPIVATVPSYLITRDRAAAMLSADLVTEDFRLKIFNLQKSLVTLGLVKPTYDLMTNALNHAADGIGGFYRPWTKDIFILSLFFRGMEHFIYSHEFDHALVDMNFDMERMGVGWDCVYNDDQCQAIDALIEGDAQLLMYQWLGQYAGPQDYRDLLSYRAPMYALPEDFPPPYSSQNAYFPYDYGYSFVSEMYERGNWAEVNKAYANLPTSTEQILHTEKYFAGEHPMVVEDPALAEILPADWSEIESNVMGEWMTYLLLGYGADYAAQVDDRTAAEAAAGWGGDHYQVYHNASTDQTALAAHWVWETNQDAQEFSSAMLFMLNERYRGTKLERATGSCWEVNGQASCAFIHENQNLWIIAPDQGGLELIKTLFPDFP